MAYFMMALGGSASDLAWVVSIGQAFLALGHLHWFCTLFENFENITYMMFRNL